MKNAVKGGFQTTLLDRDLFIGKVLDEGEWKIGKVVGIGLIFHGLWIAKANGGGHNVLQFYLLKYNSTAIDNADNPISFYARNGQ